MAKPHRHWHDRAAVDLHKILTTRRPSVARHTANHLSRRLYNQVYLRWSDHPNRDAIVVAAMALINRTELLGLQIAWELERYGAIPPDVLDRWRVQVGKALKDLIVAVTGRQSGGAGHA